MFIEIKTPEGREIIPIANITIIKELDGGLCHVTTYDGTVTRHHHPNENYIAFKGRLANYVRGRYPYNTKDALKPMNLEES